MLIPEQAMFLHHGIQDADGSGTTYADGANYTMGTSDVTLYAQWDVYVPPCIDESFESSTFPPAGWTNSQMEPLELPTIPELAVHLWLLMVLMMPFISKN